MELKVKKAKEPKPAKKIIIKTLLHAKWKNYKSLLNFPVHQIIILNSTRFAPLSIIRNKIKVLIQIKLKYKNIHMQNN